jgi:hypothetical protein
MALPADILPCDARHINRSQVGSGGGAPGATGDGTNFS